jgi:hypothetical protein
MQSYEEKFSNYTAWIVSTQGLDSFVAQEQAAAILKRLPAWATRGKA